MIMHNFVFCHKFYTMDTLERIKELFTSLDFADKITLVEDLALILEKDRTEIIAITASQDADSEESVANNIEPQNCPHCDSGHIINWGKHNNRPRFKCKVCKRTFSPTTSTVSHNIKKKENWDKFTKELFSGQYFTVKELAKRSGISASTSFDWRNKLLCSLNSGNEQFLGTTEIDDVWFLYSQKGRKGLDYARKRGGSSRSGDNDFQAKLLITSDRKETLDMSLVRVGRLQKQDVERTIGERLSDGVTLVSDKHPSISAFAKDIEIDHFTFKAKTHGKDKECHVQKVNNIAARFKAVINHKSRGVSTKYLQNYANWFRITERFKNAKNQAESIIEQCKKTSHAWDRYVNTEKLYSEFIKTYSVRTYRCPTKREWKSQNWNFVEAAS